MGDMVGDLVCVLGTAGVPPGDVVCLGHDWGSQICYEAARMRPDIFDSVIGIALPYINYDHPFSPSTFGARLMHRIRTFLLPFITSISYQTFFADNTHQAAEELGTNVRRTLTAAFRTAKCAVPKMFLRDVATFMGSWNGLEIPSIPFFSEAEEEYVVEQYQIQGFAHTLQFYTHGNRRGSWELAQEQGNFTVPQLALSVLPTNDPVANWRIAEFFMQSKKYVPNLHTQFVPGAHWPHLEHPHEINKLIKTWLDQSFGAARTSAAVRDEM
ncbi:alpha/beta-hydrolase [Punctularia strigosozonata HHB-11173 SS5]|uniref:alpha/beta-hydrolase n=1 Tax=Punctularia strigosozonata (strain HHB-11173) TaxID=741275 RepID=UPI000441719F|nr:alpha/beta-hydrolase [Punctularia strigosozonata HHB-11173 SS5]EIN12298.1 alpha/beta-hydrolase [Punctularia strigosozonata HHB-11173 SS5]